MPIHDVYEKMNAHDRGTVDMAYRHTTDYLKSQGVKCCGDDRAERLVEAIARYMDECKKE